MEPISKPTPENDLRKQEAISAYAAMGKGQSLVPYEFTPGGLGSMEIEVRITHCGICHTDLHLINDDLGLTAYPLVPGHEIVGTIARLGTEVKNLVTGQRVGIGWLAGADFTCEQCRKGKDNLCENAQPTCMGHEGGFATHVRVDSRMAHPIPEKLSSEQAAPLLCAGITVFAPLLRHHVSGNSRLGVIGIGGLGHLALQYGRALGCHVTAFSTSADKEKEAITFGANDFVHVTNVESLSEKANSCDFILSTATGEVPWTDYLNVLKPEGKLCLVGVPESELKLPVLPLLFGQKSVVGSVIGSRTEMQEMLEFSARHQILPLIEKYQFSEVNTALKKIAKNEIRYRAVLEMDGRQL